MGIGPPTSRKKKFTLKPAISYKVGPCNQGFSFRSDHGLLCWEEWEEEAVLAEDGVTVVTPAKTTGAWSVRYDEAYAFEAAYRRSK